MPIPQKKSVMQFFNLRSQLIWEFRDGIKEGRIAIGVTDARLVEDVTSIRYSISGDKVIKVESKDDHKKRIGRSPDALDAVVYAFADVSNEYGGGDVDFGGGLPKEGWGV